MRIDRRPESGEWDAALGGVMFDAIHGGSPHYTKAERHAWAPTPPAGPGWTARLARQRVLVAHLADAPVGFITLDHDLIDLAFVAAQAQGRGVFSALYAALEDAAGQRRLRTFSSLAAQPAFLTKGFRVIRHETVARGSERLHRAQMEKVLR